MKHITRTALTCVSIAALTAVVAPAQAQERSLAGVSLGTSIQNVVSRFGNPTQVVVGDAGWRMPTGVSTALSATPATGAGPEGGMSPYPVSPGSGGLPALGGSPFGSPFGGGFPGAPGSSGMPMGEGGMTAPAAPVKQQELTLIYNQPKSGLFYEFLFNPRGQAIQVKAVGYGNSGNVRTSRGISLGSTYAAVLGVYGYPEEQVQTGPIIIANYKSRSKVSFQFLRRSGEPRVIAIAVAGD